MELYPIKLLKTKVTPFVIENQSVEKSSVKKEVLLEHFYPILLLMFYRFPERLEASTQLNHGLFFLFKEEPEALQSILTQLSVAYHYPKKELESLFNQAVTLSAQILGYESGPEKIVSYLGQYDALLFKNLPLWAVAIFSKYQQNNV